MFLRRSLPSCLLLGGVAVVLTLVSTRPAHAQAKPPADDPPATLQVDFPTAREKEFRALIREGVEGDLDEKTQKLIDTAAQYFTYRFTWLTVQRPSAPTKPSITSVFHDLESTLRDFETHAKKGARNEKVRQRFLEQVVASLKRVMTTPQERIARVNGARALALVAQMGYENVADVLLEVLQDNKQNDAAKYWALVGLTELFTFHRKPGAPPIKNKEREDACIQALLKAVDMKGPPMNAPREQVEGFRTLRREAVRALALTGRPVLTDEKAKTVKARPALTLLRVLAQPDGFIPETRFDEQLEAAVGLARMEARTTPDYQPDYAAMHIARFIVRLAERYQDKAVKEREPDKVHAARLGEALDQMAADVKKNVKDKDAVNYVSEVARLGGQVLRDIEKEATPRAQDLLVWMNSNPSKSTELFRGVPESEVKPVEKPELPPAEKPAEPKK